MYETREASRLAHHSARPTVTRDRDGAAPVAVSLADAVAGAEAAVDTLAGVHVAAGGGRELLDAAVALQRLGDRLASVKLGVLAEADQRGTYADDGAATLASWYRVRTGLDAPAAARQVRTGARLARLPALAAALAGGEVTAAHAQVIATAAIPRRVAAIQAVEEFLVELAREQPPAVLRRVLARIRDAADPDGSADTPPLEETGPDERRELHHTYGWGLWHLRGELDILTGEKLASLLDAYDTPDDPDTPKAQRRSAAQRRHDALDRMLDRLIALGDSPTIHGATAHILAGIDLGELLGDTPLSRDPDTLAALLADPATTPAQLRDLFYPPAPGTGRADGPAEPPGTRPGRGGEAGGGEPAETTGARDTHDDPHRERGNSDDERHNDTDQPPERDECPHADEGFITAPAAAPPATTPSPGVPCPARKPRRHSAASASRLAVLLVAHIPSRYAALLAPCQPGAAAPSVLAVLPLRTTRTPRRRRLGRRRRHRPHPHRPPLHLLPRPDHHQRLDAHPRPRHRHLHLDLTRQHHRHPHPPTPRPIAQTRGDNAERVSVAGLHYS